MDFGERLKITRSNKGISQTELGEIVGVHYTQIGRYETKGVMPSGDVLSKVANTLDVTVDFLINGSKEGKAQESLKDQQLLRLFQNVEQLPDEKKEIIKELLESFLLKYDIEKRVK